MPRIPRLFENNVYYHVMARGNQKQKVFLSDANYRCYLNILKKYKRKFLMKLYCFCLMPNHVHLVVKPNTSRQLSLFMQCLNQSYAIYFNAKYQKCGHLWQGRFKSMVIGKESYLLDCIEYVEQNPVRAQIANSPAEYPWGSYQQRIFKEKNNFLDSIEDELIEGKGRPSMSVKPVPK